MFLTFFVCGVVSVVLPVNTQISYANTPLGMDLTFFLTEAWSTLNGTSAIMLPVDTQVLGNTQSGKE